MKSLTARELIRVLKENSFISDLFMIKRRILFIFLLGAVISFGIVLAAGPAAPQPVAPEERIHVAYIENDFTAGVSRIKYGVWDGSPQSPTFQTIDMDSRVYSVYDSALDTALGSDKNHHIVYLKSGVARYRNNYRSEIVPVPARANGSRGISIDLNSRHEPVVASVGRDNNLYLARQGSSGWTVSNALLSLPAVADARISLAVNETTGNYHIFYTHRVTARQTDLREFIISPNFTIAGNNLVKSNLDASATFNFRASPFDVAGTYEDFADIYFSDSSSFWMPHFLGQSSGFSDFDSIGMPVTWAVAPEINGTSLDIFYSFDRNFWATSSVITLPSVAWYPVLSFSRFSGMLGIGYVYNRMIFGQQLNEIGVSYSKRALPPFNWRSGVLLTAPTTGIQYSTLKIDAE